MLKFKILSNQCLFLGQRALTKSSELSDYTDFDLITEISWLFQKSQCGPKDTLSQSSRSQRVKMKGFTEVDVRALEVVLTFSAPLGKTQAYFFGMIGTSTKEPFFPPA